jgi:hypothetical protein
MSRGMKIKKRKVNLHQITVPMGGRRLTVIHVTPKQLEKWDNASLKETL